MILKIYGLIDEDFKFKRKLIYGENNFIQYNIGRNGTGNGEFGQESIHTKNKNTCWYIPLKMRL